MFISAINYNAYQNMGVKNNNIKNSSDTQLNQYINKPATKFNLTFGNKLATDIADAFGKQVGEKLLETLATQISIVKGQTTDSRIIALLEKAGVSLRELMSDTIKKYDTALCGNLVRVNGKFYTEEELCNLILKSNKYLEQHPELLERFVLSAPDNTTPGYFRSNSFRFGGKREDEPSLLPVLKEIAELRSKPHKRGFKETDDLYDLCNLLAQSPEYLAKGKSLLRIYDIDRNRYFINIFDSISGSTCIENIIKCCPDNKLQRAAILYSKANWDYFSTTGLSTEFRKTYNIATEYVNLSYEELIKKFAFLKDAITKEQWDAAGRGELKTYGSLVFD